MKTIAIKKKKTSLGFQMLYKIRITSCMLIARKKSSKKGNKYFIAMVNVLMPFYSSSIIFQLLIYFSYGFCIPDNKYDSFVFRVKLNMNINHEIKNYAEFIVDTDNEE